MSSVAVDCRSYGCGNRTTDPSGLCYHHGPSGNLMVQYVPIGLPDDGQLDDPRDDLMDIGIYERSWAAGWTIESATLWHDAGFSSNDAATWFDYGTGVVKGGHKTRFLHGSMEGLVDFASRWRDHTAGEGWRTPTGSWRNDIRYRHLFATTRLDEYGNRELGIVPVDNAEEIEELWKKWAPTPEDEADLYSLMLETDIGNAISSTKYRIAAPSSVRQRAGIEYMHNLSDWMSTFPLVDPQVLIRTGNQKLTVAAVRGAVAGHIDAEAAVSSVTTETFQSAIDELGQKGIPPAFRATIKDIKDQEIIDRIAGAFEVIDLDTIPPASRSAAMELLIKVPAAMERLVDTTSSTVSVGSSIADAMERLAPTIRVQCEQAEKMLLIDKNDVQVNQGFRTTEFLKVYRDMFVEKSAIHDGIINPDQKRDVEFITAFWISPQNDIAYMRGMTDEKTAAFYQALSEAVYGDDAMNRMISVTDNSPAQKIIALRALNDAGGDAETAELLYKMSI